MTTYAYENGQTLPTNTKEQRRRTRQDFTQEHVSSRNMLGSYRIGNTLGEGEFGKVRVAYQKGTNLQVAVKMIRRDKLTTEGRRAKVDREINILSRLQHPNIVKYYEKIEDPTYIGVVLEYAAGGELFDYILRHHYLRDESAQKLFAQLVSGVGYLHKNGIIHRDLKLENLLLDGQQNIIITDFGFANTFDPKAEVSEEEERRLNEARHRDKQGDRSHLNYRKADLMSTSCGSPCYAAPELVVSDGLYHGRKVDVWSCGVILYAMLAGYLPYDDDPNNPEGDNINLLYKYICNSSLIFPPHISPRARDLLKQILVPDPKRRADLFEVARHSWLIDYSDLVEDVTSRMSFPTEQNGSLSRSLAREDDDVARQERLLNKNLTRSASMTDNSKAHQPSSPVGGLTSKPGRADMDAALQSSDVKTSRDAKRRTVQVEYKAPQAAQAPDSDMAARPAKRELRPEPPQKDYSQIGGTPGSSTQEANVARARSGRNVPRSTSDTAAFSGSSQGNNQRQQLPPSRGSYGRPTAPELTSANAQGRFSYSPKPTGAAYTISTPVQSSTNKIATNENSQPLSMAPQHEKQPNEFDPSQTPIETPAEKRGHHRRGSSTLSQLVERTKSIGRRKKNDRMYPPTSMRPVDGAGSNRQSSESPRASLSSLVRRTSDLVGRRSTSDNYNNSRMSSTEYSSPANREKRHSRRFSFFSRKPVEMPDPPLPEDETQPPQTAPQVPNTSNPFYTNDPIATRPSANTYSVPGKTTQFQEHRKFSDAYGAKGNTGTSGPARRVMDLFRRRR